MSETTTATTDQGADTGAQGDDAAKGGQSGNYTPPATQADLDRIIADRIARERAKYADYDDLKAKAAKYDEAVEAQKSEAQKAIERAEAAEAALAAKEAEALRLTVAAKHGITGDYLDLVQGADEAALEAAASKVAALIAKGPKGPVITTQGTEPTAASTEGRDWLRNALTRTD